MKSNENENNEENLGKEIDELLDQGLSQKDIETRGYSPSLIRQRIRKRARAGKTPPRSGRNDTLAIRREKESILPEWLEKDVAEIFDGQTRDQRIFLAGMSVPLMGLRLFAEGVKPIIDLLTIWQEGQAQAARESERTGIEMAQAAGEAAATGVGKFFMETKPWLSAAPNPFQAMMADTMRPILQQVMGQVIASVMHLTSRGQVGLQPSAGTGVPPQGGSQSPQHRQPGGMQEASNEEIKEAFND
jgi:hypothetical protein